MPEKSHTATSLKWWQWLLMYPTLAVALAGHVPKLYELYQSYQLKVPFGQVHAATKQNEDFNSNIDCLLGLEFHSVPGGDKASIAVGVCPRGALVVLVQPHDPKAQPIYRVVSWTDSANERQTSLLFKDAVAAEPSVSFRVTQAGTTIICRKRIDNELMLIRIRYPNGQCFDQTVNTYTGAVISTVPAPCDSHCS
jgi:hypothetical protein